MLEAFPNSVRRHRLEPEPFNGLFRLRILRDQPENQLTFPSRITGIDDFGNIFSLDQLVQHFQSGFRFCNRFQRKIGGDNR